MAPSTVDLPFKLEFDDKTNRIAGSNVSGEVIVDAEKAHNLGLDSIKIVLKGVLKNVVTRQNGTSLFPSPNRHSELLVLAEKTIWTSTGTSSEKESSEQTQHFSLALPKYCLSTFHYRSKDPGQQSNLKYSIKVVGVRSGLFKSNLKQKVYFPVLSMHSASFDDRLALVQGWGDRPRFHIIKNHAVHKNVVGAKLAETSVNLQIPQMDSYPIGYPIPYDIIATIVYEKSHMDQSATAESQEKNSVALPSPQAITFNLMKYHRIQAYGKFGAPHDDIGRTNIANLLDLEKAKVERKPLEFIPDGQSTDSGRWKQEMRITGYFVNNDCGDYLLRPLKVNVSVFKTMCRPDSKQYTIDLTVPFQGLMNNIIYITPIKFTRGPIDDFVAHSEALSQAAAAVDDQVDLPKYDTRDAAEENKN